MSRGAQRTTRQRTDQELAQQNSQIAQENQSDAQDRSEGIRISGGRQRECRRGSRQQISATGLSP
jgi:hypothetical protein